MGPNVASPLRAVIVTPAARGSRSGNRKTALRYAGLLRQLGLRPRVVESWQDESCDLLLAVHAVKTADSVLALAAARPATRIAILLAGTDIYPEFRPDPKTASALTRADALIALQPRALDVLPADLRSKTRAIVQSATAEPDPGAPFPVFTACVLAHLRPVKQPLLPFEAVAHVPGFVTVEVVVAGRALTRDLADAARAASTADPRCRWLGELSRREARRLLARSRVCIVPSSAEGGANVVSEAIAAGTPILATSIPGNVGLLGPDWPGLFASGDARGLGALLTRAASDSSFYNDLAARTRGLQHLVAPARERDDLRALLVDLGLTG